MSSLTELYRRLYQIQDQYSNVMQTSQKFLTQEVIKNAYTSLKIEAKVNYLKLRWVNESAIKDTWKCK